MTRRPVPRRVLVERVQEPEELKSMEAVIETQRQLEDVVEDLLSSVHGVPKKRVSHPCLRHGRHHVGLLPPSALAAPASVKFPIAISASFRCTLAAKF